MTRTAEAVYTIAEAAECKRVSETVIRRAVKATAGNVLKAKKVGRTYRIAASELDAWFERLDDA